MTINEIIAKYNNGGYSAPKGDFMKILPQNHIFDENLTVKANRELVEEHNNRAHEQRMARFALQSSLEKQLREDVSIYIADTYDLSFDQADIVERFIYDAKHYNMALYFDFVDDIAQLVEDVINCK